ncbi:hypothetical protein UA08_01752 [Talaromyces atroroseus]|uniref:Uncharacterized protein n=1 Tax=Talaromyces atroroseus TaxID=1441469 RepID=A0A1Q5QBQ4_TALAT|nr:hypothetical protein UA08_01752 [Talaromyces atroroseus]OKL63364.1 hypothetical protein UA08_01752 [Talaromyces atroroseus]
MNIIWQVAGIIDSFFVHGCPYQQDRPKDADAADYSVPNLGNPRFSPAGLVVSPVSPHRKRKNLLPAAIPDANGVLSKTAPRNFLSWQTAEGKSNGQKAKEEGSSRSGCRAKDGKCQQDTASGR